MINNTWFNPAPTVYTPPSSDLSGQVIDEKKSSSSVDDNHMAADSSQKSVHLSNRAEKLSALSNEFFQGGTLASQDVDALIERTYEYGFISKSEYLKLSENSASETVNNQADKTSTTSLIDYINEFKERLNNLDETEFEQATPEEKESLTAMKKALDSAQSILSDIEQAKLSPNFKTDLQDTIIIFKDIINSEAFATMELDDKVNLTNVEKTLEIIDTLSPQRLTNKKVNQYIDISLK